MPIVKFFSGDLKSYEGDISEIIQKISEELEIEPDLIKMIQPEEEKYEEDDEEEQDIKIKIDYYVLIQESKDYPFTCWENYFVPFTQSLGGDVDPKMFPKYIELSEENGISLDLSIMEKLLEENSAQEGLHGLVKACVEGYRYSPEILDNDHFQFKKIFDKMVEKGAQINKEIIDMIMSTKYDNPKYFEDEVQGIVAKGLLLRILYNYESGKELVGQYTNWDTIVPVYWEDLVDWNEFRLDQRYDYKTSYYMALKHEFEGREEED